MSPPSPRCRWRSVPAFVFYAVCAGFLAMVPCSFLTYTSVGFDREYEQGGRVVEDFYRVRWPGDGSFRIGAGSIHYTFEEEDVDPIDLGLRVLDPPQRELSLTSWLRFAYATDVPEGDKGELKSSNWLIIPSWFAALLLGAYPLARFWRKRGRDAGPLPPNPIHGTRR